MSGEIINCFNGVECIYKECPMYSEKLDLCKIELLKQNANPVDNPHTEKRKPVAEQGTLPAGNTIRNLNVGDKKINIGGRVDGDPIQRDIDTSRGPATVTSIIVNDGTGKAKVSFWGENGDKVMNFASGDGIVLENLWTVKEFYEGVPQITAGKYAKVKKA